MLNVILLTADEASELCSQLRSCFLPSSPKEKGREIFDQLFPAWCLNPFAAIALCWLEPSLSMPLQAEKLVQLFESPVFVHVRLQLINAKSGLLAPLLQSLYGLLMILPQSNAYHLLQNRLSGITPLHVIMRECDQPEWV